MKCFLALSLLFGAASANFDRHVRRVQQTIVGGDSIEAREWFGVFDKFGEDYIGICGLSLIHSDIALTAAHCAEIFDTYGYPYLRFNSTLWTSTGTLALAIDKVLHPGWNADAGEGNDLAIVVLNETLTLETVTLNSDASIPADGDSLYGIGFGLVNGGIYTPGELPDDLQGGSMTAYGTCSSSCVGEINDNNVICAAAGPAASCFGDSGGPWLYGGEDSSLQVAVTSFLVSCDLCEDSAVSGFTRVSTYYDWIQDQICAYSADPPSTCTAAQLAGNGTPYTGTPRAEASIVGKIKKFVANKYWRFQPVLFKEEL